ncbi:MAG: DUF3300 domain-containing protein [Candidatus Sulfotelmatobacter sp.]
MRLQTYSPALRTPSVPELTEKFIERKERTFPAWIALAALLMASPLQAHSQDSGQYAPDQQGYDQQGNQLPQSYGQRQYDGSPSYSQPSPDSGPAPQGYGQAQPLSAQDLEQLVAPIALYPDSLVAQILTASTYPEQVADAHQWRRSQGYASSDQIAAGADAQFWDPSVKALTAFPQVLSQMDQNLHWTSELGEAYYNQPQDVLQAVQVMRQRAQAAGTLRSTPQEVVSYDQGNIVLAPVNPQVVYVPAYNPWVVYGQPVSPYPGFSLLGALGSFFGSSPLQFGLGIAMTAFSHTPFGLLAWGLNWLTQSVLFHGSDYYSHSATVADWGLPHGGPRAWHGRQTANWSNRSYRPGQPGSGYGRAGSGYSGSYNGRSSLGFAATHDRAYTANRAGVAARYNRGHQTTGAGYTRNSREAYNSFRPAVGRSPYGSQQFRSPQSQYGRSAYGGSGFNGSGFSNNRSINNRSVDNHGSRVGSAYSNSMRAYRAPGSGFQRSDFGKRSSGSFKGSGLKSGGLKSSGFAESSGKRSRSGGFHFGGGKEPKAPKHSGGGKSFSARSHGGGHSGGHSHGGSRHHG